MGKLTNIDKLITALSLFEMKDNEVWKEISFIPELKEEERYFISNYGEVISLCRNVPIKLQPYLRGSKRKKYNSVKIHGKAYKIHRLVAQAFIANPENKPMVHHKDNNPLNNYYENLQWVSNRENTIEYYKQKNKKRT